MVNVIYGLIGLILLVAGAFILGHLFKKYVGSLAILSGGQVLKWKG